MNRVSLGETALDYELSGEDAGEVVALVHHGAGADWFRPLMGEPSLSGRFRLLRYHRPGYAASGPLPGPITFSGEAEVFRALMRALGLDRAHVVGHSASGCIALQMALDLPDIVHTVALLEPALMAVASPPEVPEALRLYAGGETARAVETFLRGTCGAPSRQILEATVPGALERARADAATFFTKELPALRAWRFGPDDARRVTQPALAVLGERSDERFRQRQALLLEWLPNVEPFVLSGAGHLLYLENPRDAAEALAGFFARHPMRAAA